MSLQYKLLSLLFLLTSSTLLFSQDKVLLQPPLLIDSVKSYQLNDFYYLLEDKEEQLTIEEVASSTYEQTFVPIKNLSPLKVGMVYWGRISKTTWTYPRQKLIGCSNLKMVLLQRCNYIIKRKQLINFKKK